MPQFDPNDRSADAAPSEPAHESANGSVDGKGPQAADRLLDDLAALGDQAAVYLSARKDQFKLSVRRAVVGIVLGVLALTVAAAVLVTAAAITVTGIARGLAELFGQRLWLGELVAGTSILALVAIGSYFSVQKMLRSSRWQTINRYAQLHKRSQSRHRHSAPQSTAGPVGE